MSFADVVYGATGLRMGSGKAGSDAASQILIASLLALVARSDGGISTDESLRMVELLRNRFQLQPGEALDLLTRSSGEVAGHTTDLDKLFTALNEKLTLAQKEDLMLMVLDVISADNQKAAGEMQLLATLLEGLNVPDKIMAVAEGASFEAQSEPLTDVTTVQAYCDWMHGFGTVTAPGCSYSLHASAYDDDTNRQCFSPLFTGHIAATEDLSRRQTGRPTHTMSIS